MFSVSQAPNSHHPKARLDDDVEVKRGPGSGLLPVRCPGHHTGSKRVEGGRTVQQPTVKCVLDTAAEIFNEPVRSGDRLSDLGVDSFLIIALCQRLEERLGIDIDVQMLLNADCLGAFAESLPTTADPTP